MNITGVAFGTVLVAAPAAALVSPPSPPEGVVIPAPELDERPAGVGDEVAVLAGGCFWGVQGVFQHVEGVVNALSGYAGGEAEAAHYEMVGTGTTGHAEAVEITFDPEVISFGQILQIYFSVAHDPTQLDRQGPDVGPQYRSAIFPSGEEQERVARAYIDQLDQAGVFDAAIVTSIEPDRAFYPAEDYHQDFMELNPTYPYIVRNDLPKVEALEALFPDVFRADPVLVSEAGSTG
jgi:peptide-methionine (S)-S-oxide reductase